MVLSFQERTECAISFLAITTDTAICTRNDSRFTRAATIAALFDRLYPFEPTSITKGNVFLKMRDIGSTTQTMHNPSFSKTIASL
jgi:hypothetical protein